MDLTQQLAYTCAGLGIAIVLLAAVTLSVLARLRQIENDIDNTPRTPRTPRTARPHPIPRTLRRHRG